MRKKRKFMMPLMMLFDSVDEIEAFNKKSGLSILKRTDRLIDKTNCSTAYKNEKKI